MSRFVLTAQLQLQAPSNVRQVVQQIQNQLNNVRVDVQVQGAQQAQRQINQVTASTNDAANAATRLGRSFGLSIKRFAAFSIATRAVSLFTSTLSKAVEESIAFERELIKISQVTGKTLGQLRDLTSEITRLSTSLGVSSTSLLSVSRILSQAGLNADETRIALDALAKSELAPTFDDIQQTAEGVVAVFNQFEQGAAALEAQLGSINAVAGKFAVEAGDLISVVRRTGGVFKAAGGDLNELIALFTSVRATTRESAESIATGLRTIFTRIQRPQTIEFLRQYGVELLDLEGKFVGPFEATKRLSEALAGLEQGDITFVKIAEELGGFRQIGKVIPLLQQFSVAQEALNVAQKGSGSLADDAAKAQLSLAVRITKVKEEFLALVRSITETTSFQLFANTALNLASALIKLADALKPIIPLLTAFAGIKLATGVGSFIRGISGGLRTPRGFASGGLVPGSGNRDTVPAMLTPGEFVIRKSSVAKLGAGNLAAMNENRYAAGGIVTSNRHGYGIFGPNSKPMVAAKRRFENTRGSTREWKALPTDEKQRLAALEDKPSQRPRNTLKKAEKLSKERGKLLSQYPGGVFSIRPNAIGGFFLTPESGSDGGYKLAKDIPFDLNGQAAALLGGSTLKNYVPFRQDLKQNSKLNNIVDSNIQVGIKNATQRSSEEIGSLLGGPISLNRKKIKKAANKVANDKQVYSTAAGYMFEGIIQGLTGARLAGGTQSFDFPKITNSQKQNLATFFSTSASNLSGLIKADAKRSMNSDSNLSIMSKVINDIKAGNTRGVKKLGGISTNKVGKSRQAQIDRKAQQKHFGGLIQKFETGGEAEVDPNSPTPKQLNFLKSLASKFYTDEASIKRFLGQVYDKNTASRQIQGLQAAQRWAPLFKRLRTEGNMVELFGNNARPYAYAKIGNASAPFDDLKDEKTIREFLKRGKLAFGSSVGQTKGRYGGTRTYSASGRSSYYRRALGGLIREFASGGSVGTDTVPALLTPGEFVINRSSAQKIGYGSLNRMNKVGKYANGGVVHKFASGTSGTGVPAPSGGSSSLPISNLSKVLLASQKNIALIASFSPELANRIKEFAITIGKGNQGVLNQSISTLQLINKMKARGASNDEVIEATKRWEATLQERISKEKAAKAVRDKLEAAEKKKAALIEAGFGKGGSGTLAIQAGAANAASGSKDTAGIQKAANEASVALKKLVSSTNQASSANAREAASSNMSSQADMNEAKSSNQAALADQQQAGAGMGFGNGLFLATATLQSFLPAVDENSSAMLKATSSLLSFITMVASVGFLMSALGVSVSGTTLLTIAAGVAQTVLTANTSAASAGCLALAASATAAATAVGGSNALGAQQLSKVLEKVSSWFTKLGNNTALLGKLAGVAKIASAFTLVTIASNMLIKSIYDQSEALKKAQEQGDIRKSEDLAGQQYDLESAGFVRTAGNVLVGGIYAALVAAGTVAAPGIGTAVGAAVATTVSATLLAQIDGIAESINVLFGGNTRASVVALAGANAAAAKASKSLKEANEKTSKAMEEFRNGTASATDVLKASSEATKDALVQRQKANKAIEENEKNKSGTFGGIARGALRVGTLGIAGLLGVESGAQRNARIDQENEALDTGAKKAEQDAIKAAMPGLQVLARETAATGGSFADFQERIKATDPALAELLLRNGANEIKKTFENLAKEAEKTRKAFEAMNLGFQNVAAISGALSVNMANYLASQEAGYSQLDNTIRTLEASVTSAAQGISDDAFTGALANARAGLEKLGATDEQIKKFEENLTAINTVQKNYAKASEETKNRLVAEFQRGAGAGQSPEQKKNTFADVVADQLAGAGIGEEVRNRISDAIKGAEISGDDLNKILEGDLSVLDKVLTELGDKTLSQVIGPLQELAKYEQELVNITKKRLDLENQVVSAQQNLIAAQAEAAEIIAKYGGPAFTPQMQTQSILDQANVQSDAAGVSRLRTGSAAELNQRSRETRAGLDRIATIRQQAANPNDPNNAAAQAQLSGESGVRLQEQEKRLQELAKSDYDTTKKLIQQKEKELQVIQEKNKAEKAAIDSLLAGDIDKWFEQQAAVGATAAIATGNRELMNAFGAQAVGMAAQDIKRQQDAGVTELYGQQLAGPGGLTERGYAAGLGMRGMSSPQAMAQIAAGTTAEEEAAKSEIRALAATLPNYAATQLQVAEDSLQTANIQYQAAEMQLEAAKQNAKDRGVDVAGMARGGPVYANNGIFVPRGTDTVPAMLTPGEFVVRRAAVQRGNNLQILQAMNRGQSGVSNSGGAVAMANGGRVRYFDDGGKATESGGVGFGLSSETVQGLTTALNNFNTTLSENIQKLNDTTFHVKLDSTNINVNLTGGSFLSTLKSDIGEQVLVTVGQEIKNYKVGNDGKLYKSQGLTSNQ